MDGLNPLFMEVFLLGKFEEWQSMLSLRDLQYLVKVRPPQVVLEALLRAVYHVHLSRFEAANDLESALYHFAVEVRPQFGSLYEQWLCSDKSEVLKSFCSRRHPVIVHLSIGVKMPFVLATQHPSTPTTWCDCAKLRVATWARRVQGRWRLKRRYRRASYELAIELIAC